MAKKWQRWRARGPAGLLAIPSCPAADREAAVPPPVLFKITIYFAMHPPARFPNSYVFDRRGESQTRPRGYNAIVQLLYFQYIDINIEKTEK